jgi:RND superfamily putative drug exporter
MNVRKKSWLAIALWIIIIFGALPAVLHYSDYISYSTSSPALQNTESGRAQALLTAAQPQNQSLLLVVTAPPGSSVQRLANESLGFQDTLAKSGIPNYTTSTSVFTAYASFIDTILGNNTATIRSAYHNFTGAAITVYSYPSSFLQAWSRAGYGPIDTVISESNYTGTPFQQAFIYWLNRSLQAEPRASPALLVQNSTALAVYTVGAKNPYYYAVLRYLNVTDYSSQTLRGFSLLVNQTFAPVSQRLIWSVVEPGDPGVNYVLAYGVTGAPSFILQQYVNSNSTVYLVRIYFSVPSGYVGKGGTTPAETATPKIRALAERYFGSQALLTGDGAVAYDTQKATANSGIVFAFTFVFLALAVALTLRSYLAPLVALLIVSVATLLGYVSIFITGVVITHVNFIVTYTLTAVLLGVSTDYLVFMLHRYREELRRGADSHTALEMATSRSGSAILISGLTVAASLGTFSFIAGLKSWGPVLFMGVMLTVAAELTLLPALTALIGPRLFVKSALQSAPGGYRKSRFYRAAALSVSHRAVVVALIAVLAVPAVYAWFTVPTSYNFNEGLPSNLPSVKALNLVESSFGANLIYPNYVVVNLSGPVYESNGSLTVNAARQLHTYYVELSSIPGITKIVGPNPIVNGTGNSTVLAKSFIFDKGAHAYYLFYDDYSPYSNSAISLVDKVRADHQFLVGGLTSSIIDQQAYNNAVYTELEVLIVAAIALIIGVSFRSAKYPFIALSGVFISITWTTGALYLIVRYVFHEQLLYLIPLILYVILMSLGNDYTVFIISRVREYQSTDGFREGILRGMSGSAAVVTSLGIILAVSLGSLGLAPISFLRQLGIAFIISLLLDTFVIRTFYFPAMMSALKVGPKKVKVTQRPDGKTKLH